MTTETTGGNEAGAQTNARRGPHAVRRASARSKILEAGVRCLNTTGYGETSTVKVAAEAGVARGSLLHQFPTRIDLILAIAQHAALSQGEFIRTEIARLPAGRERFVGSVDATWASIQRPEGRALLEIIVASHHDPELAARIAEFGARFDDGLNRGAQYLADAAGLKTEGDEAVEERRFMLAALRGLALEIMLSGPAASPEPVLRRLRDSRLRFYETHLQGGDKPA